MKKLFAITIIMMFINIIMTSGSQAHAEKKLNAIGYATPNENEMDGTIFVCDFHYHMETYTHT